ncbi:MAG TPA: hypothetical protein PK999_16645 [Nitrospira sp.]|nr:hypothetical protein [Nitrospira sp.]
MDNLSAFTKTTLCVACTLTPSEENCGSCKFNFALPVRLLHLKLIAMEREAESLLDPEYRDHAMNLAAEYAEIMVSRFTPAQVNIWAQYQNYVHPLPVKMRLEAHLCKGGCGGTILVGDICAVCEYYQSIE